MGQGGILPNWLRALRPRCLPYLRTQVEDGQGDRWQEARGSSLLEVQRDGSVLLPASAASRVRHLQELRGSLPCCLHGWQRLCYAWQGRVLRASRGGRQGRRQEEVNYAFTITPFPIFGHVSSLVQTFVV